MQLWTHKEFGGLYNWDGKELSAVLKLYEGDSNIPVYKRFAYKFNNGYRKATKKDRRKYRFEYYDTNGRKVLYKYNLRVVINGEENNV